MSNTLRRRVNFFTFLPKRPRTTRSKSDTHRGRVSTDAVAETAVIVAITPVDCPGRRVQETVRLAAVTGNEVRRCVAEQSPPPATVCKPRFSVRLPER